MNKYFYWSAFLMTSSTVFAAVRNPRGLRGSGLLSAPLQLHWHQHHGRRVPLFRKARFSFLRANGVALLLWLPTLFGTQSADAQQVQDVIIAKMPDVSTCGEISVHI